MANPKTIACILALAACLAPVAGCEKDDPAPSAQDAVTHFYEMGCLITSGGTDLTMTEAIASMQSYSTTAAECGCVDEDKNLRKCLGDIGAGDCYECDTQFTNLNSCISISCG